MIVAASPSTARLWRGVRFALLLIVCLLVAHEAVYATQFGSGAALAEAMSERGHDGYWTEFTLVALAAGALIASWAGCRLLELYRRGRGVGARRIPGEPGPRSYAGELIRLWLPLSAALVVAFGVQENIEHLATHGHLVGLAALTGPDHPLALPVLVLVALVAAVIGALLRLRVAVLEARIAVASRSRLPHPFTGDDRPAGWWIAGALCAWARTLDRPDAGRAPPTPLRA
jgi:hypothetical protein